jgi:hypothetical protein
MSYWNGFRYVEGHLPGQRCVEGRVYRHDPQHDDPDLETDIGICNECGGRGCKEPCPYCTGVQTSLPGNACENCINTGLAHPEAKP